MAHKHTTSTESYKIANNLFLVRHPIAVDKGESAKTVEVPTDHVMIFDCSGSMSWDLPKVREQVKKKVPKMLGEHDTFSAIWFSGRGECGVLLEKEPVATLKDLQGIEKAVDRWLKPVGMTGFKEPLELAVGLADKLSTKGRAVSVMFMSDGCDNQWGRADILKVVEKLGTKVSSTTFVEYGYYADRTLLSAMAEKAGGALIFAEDFDRYQPAMEAVIKKKPTGAKRIEAEIKGDPVGGFAYAMVDGDLVTYAASSGKIAVPEDLKEVFYLSPSSIGEHRTDLVKVSEDGANVSMDSMDQRILPAAYAATSLFAVRMKSDIVFPLLRALGDVALIEQFSTCFGKQKYSAFMEDAKGLAFGKGSRWSKGWDPNKVPRDDAFTVLDVLEMLQADPKARVLLDDPNFKYSKIGRGRVDVSANLTEAELEELRKLTDALSHEKDVTKIKELNAKIAAFAADKNEALKFVPTPQPDGYPVLKLTFNEDRPNVSIMVKKPGTIDLSKRLKDAPSKDIPGSFDTFVYRNYAVIKDGLINVERLPVRVSAATFAKFLTEGVIAAGDKIGSNPETADIILDLKALPVINRKMVKAVSAKAFFEVEYELVKAQAAQKVFNGVAKELLPEKKSAGFVEKYGDAGATWLKEQGITDYNGWAPPSTKVEEAKDFYMGKELKVSLEKLSSLPTLKVAREQVAKNKYTPSGALMSDAVKKVDAFLASAAYTKAGSDDAKEKALTAWLDAERKAATEHCRKLIFQIAQTTFSIIVGQTWFTEFSSLDENTMDITVSGTKVTCKAEMKDVEIKV